MNRKVMAGLVCLVLILLLFSGYMTYKYLHIRRELQKERFQKILSFADENITKCSLLSLERLSSDELEKGECGVEDPKLFAQKFATIIERHITSWKPDMAIALEFRHHITFESNDTVWYFEFDWGKEDISGVIDYRFPNCTVQFYLRCLTLSGANRLCRE